MQFSYEHLSFKNALLFFQGAKISQISKNIVMLFFISGVTHSILLNLKKLLDQPPSDLVISMISPRLPEFLLHAILTISKANSECQIPKGKALDLERGGNK